MADQDVDTQDGHATRVAGVMIANGRTNKGVSPAAKLYASAFRGGANNSPEVYTEALLAMQHVALQNKGDVRAINLSFGVALLPTKEAKPDGTSLLTLGLDWSARVHDTLYVVAGGQGNAGQPLPRDEYNGLTISRSMKNNDGIFATVDPNNFFHQIPGQPRRFIDLIAPGKDIAVPVPGKVPYDLEIGTSYAAPHVTGTVALLQQYADDRIAAKAKGWNANARSHLVMKAVLMNSADKLKDTGDGNLLGMTRTIVKTNGTDWLKSDARDSADNPGGRALPLDLEMGTGQLNAQRALMQFSAGSFQGAAGQPISPIGWHYGEIFGGADEVRRYPFASPLKGGSYVSITLAWDRIVDLNDTNKDGLYSSGERNNLGAYPNSETFTASPLGNLDLFLMPRGEKDIANAIWSSESTVDSVEHIFYQLPAGDKEYEFWVKRQDDAPLRNYAVAWWAVPAPVKKGAIDLEPRPFTAVEGMDTGLITVATFTDTRGEQPAKNYTATITWGDGSQSVGVITATADPDAPHGISYIVRASHTYQEAGDFVLTVQVDGQGHATDAESTIVTVTPALAGTTTAVVSSKPISVFGQPVIFTAIVNSAAGTPTGSVQFLVDGFNFGGPVALSSGSASIATNFLAVGPHVVTAVYSGDAIFAGSSGFVVQGVAKAFTEIRIGTDPNPSMESDIVRLLIAFRAAPPSTLMPTSGVINFFDDSNGQISLWFSVTLGQPSPPIPTLEVGSHLLFAEYSGNDSFLGSRSNLHPHEVMSSAALASLAAASSTGDARDRVFSQFGEMEWLLNS